MTILSGYSLRSVGIGLVVGLIASVAQADATWPGQSEGDWLLKNYKFADGEVLPEVKVHYTTIGTPKRDAAGHITNAALLLQGTSGTGKNWLRPSFANEMFGEGQPLDATKWYVIMPDAIGRGGSSKPSDGLRMRFPHYRYQDIVDSEHRLLAEHLGVDHLRLLLGGSMGGMQAWMWAGMYPDLADLVVPMASQPVRIAGRNWINRYVLIQSIRKDPGWQDGNYKTQPVQWLVTQPGFRLTSESVQALQDAAPDVESGEKVYRQMQANASREDANDLLYSSEAVMDFAPEPLLPHIRAKVLAINSADDGVNPPELKSTEAGVLTIPGARFVLIPAGPQTRGHLTYEQASVWKSELIRSLKELPEL